MLLEQQEKKKKEEDQGMMIQEQWLVLYNVLCVCSGDGKNIDCS